MMFLSQALREEGGFEYKQTIVRALYNFTKTIPESKQDAILHLCDFIEDCEFTALSVQVLHLLGEEVPQTASPASFVRYIYNRVILEPAVVRAAAVACLGKIGSSVPSLTASICVLLERSQLDDDDEVRDRATFALAVLRQAMQQQQQQSGEEEEESRMILTNSPPMDVRALSRALRIYAKRPVEGAIRLDALPVVDLTPAEKREDRILARLIAGRGGGRGAGGSSGLALFPGIAGAGEEMGEEVGGVGGGAGIGGSAGGGGAEGGLAGMEAGGDGGVADVANDSKAYEALMVGLGSTKQCPEHYQISIIIIIILLFIIYFFSYFRIINYYHFFFFFCFFVSLHLFRIFIFFFSYIFSLLSGYSGIFRARIALHEHLAHSTDRT